LPPFPIPTVPRLNIRFGRYSVVHGDPKSSRIKLVGHRGRQTRMSTVQIRADLAEKDFNGRVTLFRAVVVNLEHVVLRSQRHHSFVAATKTGCHRVARIFAAHTAIPVGGRLFQFFWPPPARFWLSHRARGKALGETETRKPYQYSTCTKIFSRQRGHGTAVARPQSPTLWEHDCRFNIGLFLPGRISFNGKRAASLVAAADRPCQPPRELVALGRANVGSLAPSVEKLRGKGRNREDGGRVLPMFMSISADETRW